jgi:uncharacterized protein (DUF885 family)
MKSLEPMSSVPDIVAHLKNLPIDEFFEESYNQLILRDPESLTKSGRARELGLGNDKLTDISDAYIRETQALEKAVLELLRAYNRDELSAEQLLSYDIYEWYLDDLVRGHQFMYYDYPVHHFLVGFHDILIRFFAEIHPVTTKKDAEDYISRLSQLDTKISQLLEGLKNREKEGVVPPKFIIEMTMKQMAKNFHLDDQDSSRAEESQLYTAFSKKLEKIELDEEEKQKIRDKALKEIEKTFIPAFNQLYGYLQYLMTIATDDAGVWKFPNGSTYYQHVLRRETSTDLTPEEIHELGLREVERIQKEMYTVFAELRYPDGSISELMERAIEDCGFFDTTTQSGKDQVIKTYEDILKEVDLLLDAVVDIRPHRGVEVVGDLSFGGGGGFYVNGSLDGSRAGAFHTGVGGDKVPKYRMQTIAYHEAIPGHHFQMTIAQELDVPRFRNDIFYNGHGEGWALYAEQLAWELGLYEGKPCGNLGRLQLELLRAVRLVADTGIHAMKWTREQAKQYMRETLGSEAATHEVDRYIVLPGQAPGYMVGMLKILELREKAMDELGDLFDIKEFHRIILGNGSVPLEIQERLVNKYIDAKKHEV